MLWEIGNQFYPPITSSNYKQLELDINPIGITHTMTTPMSSNKNSIVINVPTCIMNPQYHIRGQSPIVK